MDYVSQLLQTAIVICVVLSALLFISLGIFYKGRKKQIRVIFKRITMHGGIALISTVQNGRIAIITLLTANIPTAKSCTHLDVKKLSLIY